MFFPGQPNTLAVAATCPGGSVVIGGGAQSSSSGAYLASSWARPGVVVDGLNVDQWEAVVHGLPDSYTSPTVVLLTVYALCANAHPAG